MTKREVVHAAVSHRRPPYVPWSCGFTHEAREKLVTHCGEEGLESLLQNHFLGLGEGVGYMTDLGGGRFRDVWGVVWNRSVDKDIGNVEGQVLPDASLDGLTLPDPDSPVFMSGIDQAIARRPDLYRVYSIGFSLYERAWTLRGTEHLMMDFIENPDFVKELLRAIADFNLQIVERALRHDIDAVHFGDDWGMQQGLQMGPRLWREFLYPELRRMYGMVRDAGKLVSIHSCGDVDELFGDLAHIGLGCFNPFQPEVMDVHALKKEYAGRLAFHGGLSTQRTLPYGTPDDVRRETARLLEMGRDGGYVFAPAHAVEGDVPLENILAFLDVLKAQEGFASGG